MSFDTPDFLFRYPLISVSIPRYRRKKKGVSFASFFSVLKGASLLISVSKFTNAHDLGSFRFFQEIVDIIEKLMSKLIQNLGSRSI